MERPKTLVLGVGNEIRGDGGIGIYLARRLKKTLPRTFKIKELTTAGLDLLEAVSGFNRVILIDAIQTTGGFPGQVYHLRLDDFKFKGIGKIVTYTIIRTSLNDPQKELVDIPARNIPYVLAIIKLKEGPKLTAEIVDCELDRVKIGLEVKKVFRKIVEKGPHGVIQYGYKFKPV